MQLQQIKFQCSLYADDVILFIRPFAQEAATVKEILRVFGEASGLKTILSKCSITPIFGGEEALDEIVSILGCQVKDFPIRYLGLPLSTKKTAKAEVHSIVEASSNSKETTTLSWLSDGKERKAGLDQVVLRAVPIYSMMADSLPPWATKEIDAICRKFLWVGSDTSVRGKCMVA